MAKEQIPAAQGVATSTIPAESTLTFVLLVPNSPIRNLRFAELPVNR